MILAVNQPYFLPYIGYWQLIHAADLFLIGDDYQYRKGGWISRNRILVRGRPVWFCVEKKNTGSLQMCNEMYMSQINRRKKLNLLYDAYHKAPYYEEGLRLAEDILDCEETVLSEYLLHSIRTICAYLGITTPIGRTSDYPENSRYRREDRIYDLCRRTGADTYINLIGGTALYDFAEFRERGITLQFLKADQITYRQSGQTFVPNLSILDVIMFNSREEIISMLDRFSLITEPQA